MTALVQWDWYNGTGTMWYNVVQCGTMWYNVVQWDLVQCGTMGLGTMWYNGTYNGTVTL